MTCGVVGLGLVCTIDVVSVLRLIPSLLALPLSISALVRIGRGDGGGRGLAWTGLLTGLLGTLLYLIAFAVVFGEEFSRQ